LGASTHRPRIGILIMANHFESELTQYLKQFKADNPGTEAGQRAGRARLWDKDLDPEAQDSFRAARVPQDPYVYYQKA